MNRCLYCLRPFDGRSRCCGEWCERRVRGKAAYVTRSRREACTKLMAAMQRRLRFVPDWRRAAMGASLRHGDTLDA